MSDQLTVIVRSGDGQPAENAKVSSAPGNAKATTDAKGEAVIPLGSANTYQVTVKVGGETQTVPFYVKAGGARRILFDMKYLKTHNTSTTAAPAVPEKDSNNNMAIAGAIVIVAIVVVAIYMMVRKRRNA